MKPSVLLAGLIILPMSAGPAGADDSFADIAGKTGCGILASLLQHPQGKVTAAGACIYGTSVAKSAVADLIDKHFNKQDQEFADKYCVTIIRADKSEIKPKDRTNCSN